MDEDYELMLFDRLNMIRDTIKKYGEKNFYISFSGGKDSTVVSWMVDEAVPGNSIPRVFANTGIEFNAIVDFVKHKQETDDRIVIIKPSVSVKESLERDGYPFKSKEHSGLVQQYQRHPDNIPSYVLRYIGLSENEKHKFLCPQKLKYQFRPGCPLKISDSCCRNMKERPLAQWQKDNHRQIVITGMMASEGGRRASSKKCAVFREGKLRAFHPLKPVSESFVDWIVKENNIELCKLYYPPYEFKRTGCKGCPFNIDIQTALDKMADLIPEERKQCEAIWKPVYDEYRRLNYRLHDKLL